MKHLYLVFFLCICSIGFSQENIQSTADINGLKLYPNPVTQGKIYVETPQNSPKQIVIFDVLGTQVLRTTIIGRELNLSNLDRGVYIIRIQEHSKVATRKLIIK
ncbi:T9SS type A sorting domain-containing protein [Flagellimonas allohymeniacidonis]|uniref:T9SS type A sorting domain-containing protein n=1 Tax=Flagellimonas allohymeniacidonis TaxID=2517819 RepID=A0A4Q8QDZ2_9FLAO|nr:T9SS type A sorting domain-containing protein [Allomuricauda hymeniacidonis]TAI47954.1 T9SS type A sorting domain-containing protein [Allomuricauda hymeniacidonis]